jgi:Holliday junction resolvase
MESKIQAKIKARFENAGWIVVKLIQTNCNGIPDLMCLKGGKTIFIEVKQPGKKPTELQQFRHDQLTQNGFQVFILSSEKDIII